MESDDPVQTILSRVVKYRWTTIPVVIGVAVIAVASFTNALESLYDFGNRVLGNSPEAPLVAASPPRVESAEESPLQCVLSPADLAGEVFSPVDQPIYQRFDINRTDGGDFSSCNGDECISVSVRPVEGPEGSPHFSVRVHLPPLSTFRKAGKFSIGSIPINPGATAAIRTADFDFVAEIEQVGFEEVSIGTRIQSGTNFESIVRFETPTSTLDLFGDPETDKVWARASKGGGMLVLQCN